MSIGVIDQMEIDFVAEKHGGRKYIQVCYSLGSEAAIEREFGNLEKIKDNYEKDGHLHGQILSRREKRHHSPISNRFPAGMRMIYNYHSLLAVALKNRALSLIS